MKKKNWKGRRRHKTGVENKMFEMFEGFGITMKANVVVLFLITVLFLSPTTVFADEDLIPHAETLDTFKILSGKPLLPMGL